MIAWLTAAWAGAGSVACEFHGIPIDVRWTEDGELSAWDGPDRLVAVQVGPLFGATSAACRDEGVRLTTDLREGGGLALATVDIDLGATFDTMPDRFSPLRAATLAGARAAARGDWAGVRAALDGGGEREALVAAVLAASGGASASLASAGAHLPDEPALRDALARAHIAEGRLEEARSAIAPGSVLAGEVLWAEGRRSAARKVWMAEASRGVVLPDDVAARCPRCGR